MFCRVKAIYLVMDTKMNSHFLALVGGRDFCSPISTVHLEISVRQGYENAAIDLFCQLNSKLSPVFSQKLLSSSHEWECLPPIVVAQNWSYGEKQ